MKKNKSAIEQALLKRLKKHTENIAKERDGLRDLIEAAQNIYEVSDQAVAALEDAVELLSQRL